MHRADQLERFRELSEAKGWGAQEIGARFGLSAHVVKQRLRLGAVSPKLLQVYREEGLTLDQLMAVAITDDHARQEQVVENLHHNREPWIIRRDGSLLASHGWDTVLWVSLAPLALAVAALTAAAMLRPASKGM